MFLETSALTGENVEEAFVQCARKILNKIESGKILLILLILLEYLNVHSENLSCEVQSEVLTQVLPSLNTSLCLLISFLSLGELDPERMGSGIQYGDAALRQLRSPRRAQPQGAQECGC